MSERSIKEISELDAESIPLAFFEDYLFPLLNELEDSSRDISRDWLSCELIAHLAKDIAAGTI